MTYNKKQMQPLIDKFQINPETNKLFIKIIEMYDNQPNYQIWAVKGVFSHAFDFDTLAGKDVSVRRAKADEALQH